MTNVTIEFAPGIDGHGTPTKGTEVWLGGTKIPGISAIKLEGAVNSHWVAEVKTVFPEMRGPVTAQLAKHCVDNVWKSALLEVVSQILYSEENADVSDLVDTAVSILHDHGSPLIAYQVGDNDVVAAYNAKSAIRVYNEFVGADSEFTEDDVEEVSQKTLDATEAYSQDEGVVVPLPKTVRQQLAELRAPQYLYGWE